MLYTILLIILILWLVGQLPNLNLGIPQGGNVVNVLVFVIILVLIFKLLGLV